MNKFKKIIEHIKEFIDVFKAPPSPKEVIILDEPIQNGINSLNKLRKQLNINKNKNDLESNVQLWKEFKEAFIKEKKNWDDFTFDYMSTYRNDHSFTAQEMIKALGAFYCNQINLDYKGRISSSYEILFPELLEMGIHKSNFYKRAIEDKLGISMIFAFDYEDKSKVLKKAIINFCNNLEIEYFSLKEQEKIKKEINQVSIEKEKGEIKISSPKIKLL